MLATMVAAPDTPSSPNPGEPLSASGDDASEPRCISDGVMHLRVFGAPAVIADVANCMSDIPGSTHVVLTQDGLSGQALVTADLTADAVDPTLAQVRRLGVPTEDVVLLKLDSIGPSIAQRPLASVVWADLLSQAGANARPLARYLVFMAAAGIIAAFGVIYANTTLIVGAMAIAPDILPVTAAATALVLSRWHLAGRALVALVAGLGCACLVGYLMTLVLNALSLLPAGLEPNQTGFLDGIATVNIATPIVAVAAGVVAILGLETRASAGVGVAISVTTIPASALLAVAGALGKTGHAVGAFEVLAINVTMLLVGGCLTLVTQRALARRRAA
jgi:uncharacterized hydrophobic protein (TIGR00271 family)